MHMSVKNRKEIMLRKRPGQPEGTEGGWHQELMNSRFFRNVVVSQLTQRGVADVVVQLAVSSDFSEEQGHRGNADPGQRGHRIFDFSQNLILRETR